MIDLCVINFNTEHKLERLLTILHNDYVPDIWNLYIQDNGSTDGSKEYMSEALNTFNITKYVSNANVGYARAANDLASFGSSDIIAILNADVWLKTTDVKQIQTVMDEDPTISICGPKQRDENYFITHAGIVGTNEAPKHRGWHQLDETDILFKDRVNCVTVAGSAYFIKRKVWEDLTNCPLYAKVAPGANGAFLPTELYYEETWCSYHARAHDYRVVYIGDVSIGHSWHASSPIGSQTPKFQTSKTIFRVACDAHGISRD